MSRREKRCEAILQQNCKGLIWRQIEATLEHKEFEIIPPSKTGGSQRSITHKRMKEYREAGRIFCFPNDCFNIHVHRGDKTELGKDDCKKIRLAMTFLELQHC